MRDGLAKGISVDFQSPIDKKGRALLSADIRRALFLKFGSEILVETDSSRFATKVDERGRFGVPKEVRDVL